MAGIRQSVLAGEGNPDAASSSEAELALRDQRIVEAEENLARVMRGLATKSAEDHRHPHGRSQTLSGDIADNGNEGAVWCRGYEEEVATDLTSREVDRFHLEARRGA